MVPCGRRRYLFQIAERGERIIAAAAVIVAKARGRGRDPGAENRYQTCCARIIRAAGP